MKETPEKSASRRDFLKLASVSAPAAVAAVAVSGTQAEASVVDPSSDRMQDTEHTRAYFETARF
ncbi:ubiquinol-cytochrome c reductase iron-sulfur subunit N-terminal domain-containing protein [Poseidonocella sedimentorum]|uniref:Formate dehydrogenase region TAT target n=1 Tax=Poseidonocella sedimentorum TaxID=871652 RepID=A0A1I6D358_9RHOB|nr:ubiquinol-cytochrome c reductase iron-sulfur subunit N-terminal domain-containing protein [Poseidonocella sedimentorum]SFQ99934.1 formate dehydrogenase region TAT target [Poseidonocella sedimentorum]